MLHKARDLLVRQRTMLINAIRANLAEHGFVASVGRAGAAAVNAALHEQQDDLPALARSALHGLAAQYRAVSGEIERLERQILSWHRASDASRRLATIPGVGPITASAIAATVPDASLFRSSRQFAAWLSLTPEAHSSGGKERLGGISKQGDGHIRRLRLCCELCGGPQVAWTAGGSGSNLEQLGDEGDLGAHVAPVDVWKLPLPHHRHHLVARQ